MRLIHLSDLHIGKRVNEFSMLEDQKYILDQILGHIERVSADVVIIAGDVYDKPIPPAEAVTLFDSFLTRLSTLGVETFIISGNHDSSERLSFGARLFESSGIHLSSTYTGSLEPVVFRDEWGEVAFYSLPFMKPSEVSRYTEREITDYTDAVREAISTAVIDPTRRNVIIAHQFVTGAQRTESEQITVGGCDNVDASVFADFDYTALGHIHRAQSMTAPNIRYSGTPLKYSFSESRDEKSVSVVTLCEKGRVEIETLPLIPLHDMVELKGSYSELMSRDFYEGTTLRDDYTHITLTDEEDVPDAIGRLRIIYRGLMRLDYDNTRTRSVAVLGDVSEEKIESPIELFSDFYTRQNGREMSKEQLEFTESLIDSIWNKEGER